MYNILIEKLQAFIVVNNPDLAVKLQGDYSMTRYLEDKVASVMPLVERLIAEGKPAYVVEELCLNEMTAELKPSRFNYIRQVIEEDFPNEYQELEQSGVLTYETINLVEACAAHFETFSFSEDNEDNRLLRYAVIAEIHNHFS